MKTSFKLNTRGISYREFVDDPSIKVVTFQWLIPRPFFSPVQRLTRFHLYREDDVVLKGWLYTCINLSVCWVGLPFGPIYTVASIFKNHKGIDFTYDTRNAISETDFSNGVVQIERLEEYIIKMSKTNVKEVSKALKSFDEEHNMFTGTPILGMKIDEPKPVFVIGLRPKDLEKEEELRTHISKFYHPNCDFLILDIDEESELCERLKSFGQGVEI